MWGKQAAGWSSLSSAMVWAGTWGRGGAVRAVSRHAGLPHPAKRRRLVARTQGLAPGCEQAAPPPHRRPVARTSMPVPALLVLTAHLLHPLLILIQRRGRWPCRLLSVLAHTQHPGLQSRRRENVIVQAQGGAAGALCLLAGDCPGGAQRRAGGRAVCSEGRGSHRTGQGRCKAARRSQCAGNLLGEQAPPPQPPLPPPPPSLPERCPHLPPRRPPASSEAPRHSRARYRLGLDLGRQPASRWDCLVAALAAVAGQGPWKAKRVPQGDWQKEIKKRPLLCAVKICIPLSRFIPPLQEPALHQPKGSQKASRHPSSFELNVFTSGPNFSHCCCQMAAATGKCSWPRLGQCFPRAPHLQIHLPSAASQQIITH